MPELWTPMLEGPLEVFVDRLHRVIARFGEATGVETPLVEFELADGSRFTLDRIDPEPGFGMVTVHVRAGAGLDEPEAMIIPIGAIRRIELRSVPDEQIARFGFTVPGEGSAPHST